jgi:hypothetical protein
MAPLAFIELRLSRLFVLLMQNRQYLMQNR